MTDETKTIRGEVRAVSFKTGGILLGRWWDLETEEEHAYDENNKRWLNPTDEMNSYNPTTISKGSVYLFKIDRDNKFHEVTEYGQAVLGGPSSNPPRTLANNDPFKKKTYTPTASTCKIYMESVMAKTPRNLSYKVADVQHNNVVKFTQTHQASDGTWVAFLFLEKDTSTYTKTEAVEE